MSTLCIFRGHLNDALLYLRRAIELCGFGTLVKRHPERAKVWLDAADNDKAYEKYKEKFGNRYLFPEADPLMKDLYIRYDRCSKAMHSSLYGLAGQVSFQDKRYVFRYFDVNDNDPNLIGRLFYVLDTHRRILQAFAQYFGRELAPRINEWRVGSDSVNAKYVFWREKWRPAVQSMMSKDLMPDDMG